jgi:RNA polymerase sigma factor (sigma-70 family)
MTDFGSITRFAKQLEAGDHQAAGYIWEVYMDKLLRLVHRKLDRRVFRRADPDDVVQSAFWSFCRAAEKGRYTLASRADLWHFLYTITIRKVFNTAIHHSRARRDYRRDASEQDYTDPSSPAYVKSIAAGDPTPLHAAIFTEEFQRLLGALSHKELSDIARMKFDGMTNAEIATALNRTARTIERKIERIRKEWETASRAE